MIARRQWDNLTLRMHFFNSFPLETDFFFAIFEQDPECISERNQMKPSNTFSIQVWWPDIIDMSFEEFVKAKVDFQMFRLPEGIVSENLRQTFERLMIDTGLLVSPITGQNWTLYSFRQTYASYREGHRSRWVVGSIYLWNYTGGTRPSNRLALELQQRATNMGIGGMTPAMKLKKVAWILRLGPIEMGGLPPDTGGGPGARRFALTGVSLDFVEQY